jgi:2-dehydro-3-deoxygalactonokinase
MSNAALIAIDWGTTSARAYRLDGSGQVIDQRSGPYGISQITDGRFDEALQNLLGDWSDDPAPRIACGMIGSRQGWREAPYVPCPASLDRLASGIVEVGGLAIVPGLITRDAQGTPDVLRGEEAQLLGAIAPDQPLVLAILPGTHSKWALIERGTVVDFRTFMTGELYAVLLAHSILGRMAEPSSEEQNSDAFERGLRHADQSPALTHHLFAARTLALTGELAPRDVAPWLSGLLLGREIHDGLSWSNAQETSRTLRIIGEPSLVRRYAHALKWGGVDAEDGPTDAAARGLWRIARQAGMLR